MKTIDIDISNVPGARVESNLLVEDPGIHDLMPDLVLVRLPNGIVIDVSWEPLCDPSGSYTIVAVENRDWDHPRAVRTALDPISAAKCVKFLAEELSLSFSVAPTLGDESRVSTVGDNIPSPELD